MFTFRDIEQAVLACGCAPKGASGGSKGKGSHCNYENERTGLSITIPQHGKAMATGTAKSIIEDCVFIAYINNINIGSDKFKLEEPVYNHIRAHHAKCKESPLFYISDTDRRRLKIDNEQQALEYINKIKQISQHNLVR